MIKSITVINNLGEKLTIELGAPETSGLWIKSIKGIGPGKANINTTELASSDGGLYNSSRSEIRNITMTLGFMPYTDGAGNAWSVEDVRRNTYRWFAKKRPIEFIVNTDRISLVAYGYVESNEPDIFQKDETTAISIICPDPNMYMYDSSEVIEFSSTADGFEFPEPPDGYENPITVDSQGGEVYTLTEDETPKAGKEYYKKISNGYYVPIDDMYPETPIPANTYYERHSVTELATITTIANKSTFYDGEVEIGLNIVVYITGEVAGLSLYKLDPNDQNYYEAINIDDAALALIPELSGGLQAGDEIRICTIVGQKSAILIREAQTYNIMNALGRNPAWFKLDQGTNLFSYAATTGSENVIIDMEYARAYEGV